MTRTIKALIAPPVNGVEIRGEREIKLASVCHQLLTLINDVDSMTRHGVGTPVKLHIHNELERISAGLK